MSGTTWSWTDKTVAVKHQKVEGIFSIQIPSARELEEYSTLLGLKVETYKVLKAALMTFQSGGADYEGAAARVENLLVEMNGAARTARDVAQMVGVFFKPQGLIDLFPEAVDMMKFALEATRKLEECVTRG